MLSPRPLRNIAAALIGQTEPSITPLDGFLIMLRSASNPSAAAIWREQTENHHQKALTFALEGERAAERAAVMLSLIGGFQVMRQMVGLSALADADASALAEILVPVFERLAKAGSMRRPSTSASSAR